MYAVVNLTGSLVNCSIFVFCDFNQAWASSQITQGIVSPLTSHLHSVSLFQCHSYLLFWLTLAENIFIPRESPQPILKNKTTHGKFNGFTLRHRKVSWFIQYDRRPQICHLRMRWKGWFCLTVTIFLQNKKCVFQFRHIFRNQLFLKQFGSVFFINQCTNRKRGLFIYFFEIWCLSLWKQRDLQSKKREWVIMSLGKKKKKITKSKHDCKWCFHQRISFCQILRDVFHTRS